MRQKQIRDYVLEARLAKEHKNEENFEPSQKNEADIDYGQVSVDDLVKLVKAKGLPMSTTLFLPKNSSSGRFPVGKATVVQIYKENKGILLEF